MLPEMFPPNVGGSSAMKFACLVDECLLDSSRTGDPEDVSHVLCKGMGLSVVRAEASGELKQTLKGTGVPNHQSVLTAAILRLLAHPAANWLNTSEWRQDVLNYLERRLPHKVAQDLGLCGQDQAHEKLAKAATAVDHYDEAYSMSLTAPTSLGGFRKQRQAFMKTIRLDVASTLVQPFLPREWEARTGELFERVDMYIESRDSAAALEAYRGVVDAGEALRGSLQDYITRYSSILRDSLCDEVLRQTKDDFAQNKAAQPADVRLEKKGKKYPFHIEQAPVDLIFIVINEGPGYAYDVAVEVEADASVILLQKAISIGLMAPRQPAGLALPARLQVTGGAPIIEAVVSWRDFDGSEHKKEEIVELEAQSPDVDWEALQRANPYSLEPVDSEDRLVGRKELLNKLIGVFTGTQVGSAIIKGQKRVGKTSLAQTVARHLRNQGSIVAYLEAGDFVHATGEETVSTLGTKLCRSIAREDKRAKSIAVPNFDQHALNPLSDFVDDLAELTDNARLVIVLDEFDSLPTVLYSRDVVGDAFFESLRSISNRKNVGFMIVGGEKMNQIVHQQGYRLNKWDVMQVDYFGNRSEFETLVQRPATGLEYSDDALVLLHQETAGNPYFSNLICQRIINRVLVSRDSHITDTEVSAAIRDTAEEVEVNSFQHFWEDGILDTGVLRNERSLNRRKVLVAVSDCCTRAFPCTIEAVQKEGIAAGVPSVEGELREFVSRGVLVEPQEDSFDFKVPLFGRWLASQGVHAIIGPAEYRDEAAEERLRAESIRVKPDEIRRLVQGWGGRYRGQEITEGAVMEWLRQFGDRHEAQRAMFNILRGVRFYRESELRSLMGQVDAMVRRNLKRQVVSKRRKWADVCVSYLGDFGKSGSDLARVFADEADLYSSNVVEAGKLQAFVREGDGVKVVLFLDDFVGTGEQVLSYFEESQSFLAWLAEERRLRVLFVALVADAAGWSRVEQEVDRRGWPVEVRNVQLLSEADKLFSEEGTVFEEDDQRKLARKNATHFGGKAGAQTSSRLWKPRLSGCVRARMSE
ncbi:MAG: ATP-binding protein [Thermoleophilia bacterium]|nr:ATP-binding protein [Thermoleophilia bacterium]